MLRCFAATLVAGALLAPEAGAVKAQIRVGGPSAPGEPMVAIVGSDSNLAGKRYVVRQVGGKVVNRGKLTKAPGKPAPWKHAYAANLGELGPGSYRVAAGRLGSRPWTVSETGAGPALETMLRFFVSNRDGNEPSSTHGPAHLSDAVVHPSAAVAPGQQLDMAGGWMDAGDMIHFTQTTAFSTALLQAAALLDPAHAGALNGEADVGIRWLVKAHPAPGVFVAQVADERDHEIGFRDPAGDAGRSEEGIAVRNAYTLPPNQIGGDLGGKTATALAMAFRRTGDPALLTAARDWYVAGESTAGPAPALRSVGYPAFAGNFYVSDDSSGGLAAAAIQLFRATGEQQFLADYVDQMNGVPVDAILDVADNFAGFGAADACGALGEPAIPAGAALDVACNYLREMGSTAVTQARSNAFGMPGYFSWGTTAQNGGSGSLAAFATVAGVDGCVTAAGARDWLLGRNPFGASMVAGFGPRSPRSIHHWAFSASPGGLPTGAVVGGPSSIQQIRDQGFKAKGQFNSSFQAYEDNRRNYVTSEPAIDYTAASILLVAAAGRYC